MPHPIYPLTCQQALTLLPILAIVNNAAVNTAVHISFQITVFIFFR